MVCAITPWIKISEVYMTCYGAITAIGLPTLTGAKDDTTDDTGVELLNTQTMDVIPLLTDTQSVNLKEYDAKTGIWTVWWTDFDKQQYVSAFDKNGRELLQLPVYSAVTSIYSTKTDIFPSPDGSALDTQVHAATAMARIYGATGCNR